VTTDITFHEVPFSLTKHGGSKRLSIVGPRKNEGMRGKNLLFLLFLLLLPRELEK